jgi:glycosyltransferase involved in cell wall biosynthesis
MGGMSQRRRHSRWRKSSTIRVLHVLSTGTRRGAELFASDLVRALDGAVTQRVAILRAPGSVDVPFAEPPEILPTNGHRFPGLRVDVRTLRALRALLASWEPAVVQAHGGEALKYAALATATRPVPIVYRRIGSAVPRIARGPRRALYSLLMRRAARVVAVAEAVRQETIDLFRLPPDRVVTIPPGIALLRVEPLAGRAATRRSLGITQDGPVILSLGALSPEKELFGHLRVSRALIREFPETVHIFAGDGPLRGDLQSFVRARGLEERVLVLGARLDVGDLLAASDVMLLASQTEGMPGCLIEAGMVGLPVVAFSVAGVPEVVVDGATGFLAAPGDFNGLTKGVRRLLRDPQLREAMGRAALDRCRARFDISMVAPRYLEIYQELAR